MASTSKSTTAARHFCEYCQKEFPYKSQLDAHRKIHLIKKDFKCSFCNYVTNFQDQLVIHSRSHTKERPYKCTWPNCTAAFSKSSGRNRHKLVHRKDDADADSLVKFRCSKCPYKTARKDQLNLHSKTHSDVKAFSCDLCPYTTKLKRHVKEHHDRMHLKVKPFKCQHPNCDSGFSQKSTLNHHQLVHNKENESLLIFECSECGYKTGRKGSLNSHLAVHSEVKPFSCDLCPYRAKRRGHIKEHLKRVHSTIKSFKCPEPNCSYSAKSQSNINGHKKMHEDYKKFACSFPPCIYKTKRKSNLKTHEMTHQNEKLIECTFCAFKCRHSISLCVHIRRRHTGESPYPCPSCPYRGKCSGGLKRHIKGRHGGKQLNPEASSNTMI